MCGRYTIKYPSKKAFADYYGINYDELDLTLENNFNIVPGTEMPVVYGVNTRKISKMKWGLIPFWSEDPSSALINARSETVMEKPAFKNSFQKRRCLVPTTGFYEWKKTDSRKWPYFITRKDDKIFSFAGLYNSKSDKSGREMLSYTILTKKPNSLLQGIHHRMPVLLEQKYYDDWLNSDASVENLKKILNQEDYDEIELSAYPVSLRVNNPVNNDPALIESVKFEKDN